MIHMPLASNTSKQYLVSSSFDSARYGLRRSRVEDSSEISLWDANEHEEDSISSNLEKDDEESADTLAARYYLRVVVEDMEEKMVWKTAEVYFYYSDDYDYSSDLHDSADEASEQMV
jgi:hypothetical protein